MRIMYAGFGIFGISGLAKILSDPNNYTSESIVIKPNDKSTSADLINNYSKNYGIQKVHIAEVNSFEYDILLSVHWREILSKSIIEKATYGGLNLHPSLLPKYAGCSSLSLALINKEKEVGFTWHLLDSEFYKGGIVLQKKLKVLENDNAFSLWKRVNFEGINYLNTCIEMVISKSAKFIKQELKKRTYFKRGFQDYDVILKTHPLLDEETYRRASYSSGKN